MCYLCSLRIPLNLVIIRQLKLNAIVSARTILEILCDFFVIVYFKKWNSSTIPPLLNFEDSAEFPPLYLSFRTTESQNFSSPTIIEKYRISMIVNNIHLLYHGGTQKMNISKPQEKLKRKHQTLILH